MDFESTVGLYKVVYFDYHPPFVPDGNWRPDAKEAAPRESLGEVAILRNRIVCPKANFPIAGYRVEPDSLGLQLSEPGAAQKISARLYQRPSDKFQLIIGYPEGRYELSLERIGGAWALADRPEFQSADESAAAVELLVEAVPERPPGKLPEFRASLKRVAAGGRAIRSKHPKNLGRKTKLGGEPDWIQEDATPRCNECKSLMTFVAQIDSLEHISKHNPHNPLNIPAGERDHSARPWMFGDVGMIFVFYCFNCGTSQSVVQGF